MGYPVSLQDRAVQAHENSVKHGFWERDCDLNNASVVAAKLCLIHSEVSEALEAVREGHYYSFGKDDKTEGLLSELADICIRVFDLAEELRNQGLVTDTIEEAIRDKQIYNEGRPHMHGGKRL